MARTYVRVHPTPGLVYNVSHNVTTDFEVFLERAAFGANGTCSR